MTQARLLYLVAGEPSGDRLGAGLMRALRAENPGVRFVGVGGREMAAGGLHSLFDILDLNVMGLVEVLPRLPLLLRRIGETTADVVARAPDALITIDSPSFGLRVAQRVRARVGKGSAVASRAPRNVGCRRKVRQRFPRAGRVFREAEHHF